MKVLDGDHSEKHLQAGWTLVEMSDVYLAHRPTHVRHTSDTRPTHIRHMSDTHPTHVRHLIFDLLTSFESENVSDVCRTCVGRVSDGCRTGVGHQKKCQRSSVGCWTGVGRLFSKPSDIFGSVHPQLHLPRGVNAMPHQ